MTFTEDFVPDEGEGLEESSGAELFGITFTPVIGGAIVAGVGIIVTIYLAFTQLMPTWDQIGQVKTDVSKTQGEIKQKQAILEQTGNLEAQLAQSKGKKAQVISLLSSEESLETILIDLNNFIEQRQAELIRYEPELEIVTVEDGSLGTALNGKMKRQTITMELEGTFDQTQSIIRNFERLQSALLVLRDFETQVLQEQILILDQNTIVPSGQPRLKTKFRIDAILPLEQPLTDETANPQES